MKSSEKENTISVKEAMLIFWDWRQASISVEVCFLSRPGTSENVRVSIDGLVRLVDSNGVVTIAGEGREMDLDLRGSEITHARSAAGDPKILNPLDPDTVLQVKFLDGEICLIFPYRRVGYSLLRQNRPESGMEWMQSMLSRSTDSLRHSTKAGGKQSQTSSLETRWSKTRKQGVKKYGPPIFPLAAFLFVFLLIVLAFTPSSIPKLVVGLRTRQKLTDPTAPVWVIPQEGDYYCRGSVLNGRKPGKFMQQAKALMLGYQPALGNYCENGHAAGRSSKGARLSAYLRTVRQGGAAIFSQLTQLSRSLLPQT